MCATFVNAKKTNTEGPKCAFNNVLFDILVIRQALKLLISFSEVLRDQVMLLISDSLVDHRFFFFAASYSYYIRLMFFVFYDTFLSVSLLEWQYTIPIIFTKHDTLVSFCKSVSQILMVFWTQTGHYLIKCISMKDFLRFALIIISWIFYFVPHIVRIN